MIYNHEKNLKATEERIRNSSICFTCRFSGGMKQRLSMISAVIHDLAIWKLARKFNSEGKTLIFTTHYRVKADKLCDRVAIMNTGKLLARLVYLKDYADGFFEIEVNKVKHAG
jgi:ABC-type multidrug transport system ATPase subunit